MKPSGLQQKKQTAKDVTEKFQLLAAQIYRAGLTDTLKAKPHEDFTVALHRMIDERISYNRWYRRLGRLIASPFAAVFAQEIAE